MGRRKKIFIDILEENRSKDGSRHDALLLLVVERIVTFKLTILKMCWVLIHCLLLTMEITFLKLVKEILCE